MKNYKIISLLALAALMSACNTNKASNKNPVTLAKLGKEVEVSVFQELFDDPDFLKPWVDLDANHYPSSVISSTTAYVVDSTYTSKKKVIGKENGIEKSTMLVKMDAKNQRFYTKEDAETNYTKNILGSEQTQKMNVSNEITYQFLKTVEDEAEKMYYVVANKNQLTCTFLSDVTTETSAARLDIIEEVASNTFSSHNFGPSEMAFTIFAYASSSIEEQEKFKFYQNKDIYSIVYTEEEKSIEMLDDDYVASTTKTKEVKTFQLDISKGNSYIYKIMDVTEVETTYLANFVDSNDTARFVDDVVKSKTTNSFSVDVKIQDTKIKEADVSDYTKVFDF